MWKKGRRRWIQKQGGASGAYKSRARADNRASAISERAAAPSKREEELVVERLPRETCGCGSTSGREHGGNMGSHCIPTA
jgi:hypothetical protein